jgi:hypothetical protein
MVDEVVVDKDDIVGSAVVVLEVAVVIVDLVDTVLGAVVVTCSVDVALAAVLVVGDAVAYGRE